VAKLHGNLAKPVTHAKILVESGEVQWSKPDWTTKSPLKSPSDKGKIVKEGGSLAKPVTHIGQLVEKGEIAGWERPDWIKKSPLSGLGGKEDGGVVVGSPSPPSSAGASQGDRDEQKDDRLQTLHSAPTL